jgi:hypothetical protein
MKIILKDYATGKTVSTANVLDGDVYQLANCSESFLYEFNEALYFINNADAESGIIADDWSDDYKTPINPYLTWNLTK